MLQEHAADVATEGFNAGAVIIEHVANSPIDHPLIHLPTIAGVDLSVTKHVLMLWVVAAVVFVGVTAAVRRYLRQDRLVPSGFMNALEAVVEFIRDSVVRREHALARLFHDREDLIHEQEGSFEQDLGIRLCALLRQIERIANGVGNVLNVPRSVVVRENKGVLFVLQPDNLRREPAVLLLAGLQGSDVRRQRLQADDAAGQLSPLAALQLFRFIP